MILFSEIGHGITQDNYKGIYYDEIISRLATENDYEMPYAIS